MPAGSAGQSPAEVGSLLPAAPQDGEVRLQVWRSDDAQWYADAVRDPEIQRWTSEPPDLSADQVRAAIQHMLGSGGPAGMAITDARTRRLLGNAGLQRSGHDHRAGEVSYWLAPEGRGRGLATRAVLLLLDWAWRCGLRRVDLFAHVDNVASQRVAERAGFRRRGVEPYRPIKGVAWQVVRYDIAHPDDRRRDPG